MFLISSHPFMNIYTCLVCVLIHLVRCGCAQELLYARAAGAFTYGLPAPESHGTNPKMTLDTLFDMASCTKVLVTTTSIAQFYQRGEVELGMCPLSRLMCAFGWY
jgi:hypothetical protein